MSEAPHPAKPARGKHRGARPAAGKSVRSAPDGGRSRPPRSTAPPAEQTESPEGAGRVLATIPIHIRWHDLDAFNHVNHAAFLILLEEARLQWLRTVPGEWFGEHAMPVMAAVQLQYRRPVGWPAAADVILSCERLGKTSLTLGNRVIQRGDPGCVYAEGSIVLVWIDPTTGAPVALPAAIRNACAL